MVFRPAFLATPNRLAGAGERILVFSQGRALPAIAATPILSKSVIVQQQPDGQYIALDLSAARSTGKRREILSRRPLRKEAEALLYPFKGGVIFDSGKLFKGGDNEIEFVGTPATEIIAFANLGASPGDFLIAWRTGDDLIINDESPAAGWFLKAYSENPRYKGSSFTGRTRTFFRDTILYEDEDPITGFGSFVWTKTRTELPFEHDISPIAIPTRSYSLIGTRDSTFTRIDERPTSPPTGPGRIGYNYGQIYASNCSYQIESERIYPIIASNLGEIKSGLQTETYSLSITTSESLNAMATAHKNASFSGDFWRWVDTGPVGATFPGWWTDDHVSTASSAGTRAGSATFDATYSEYLNRTETALNFVRQSKVFTGNFTRSFSWAAACWEFEDALTGYTRELLAKVPDQSQSYSDIYLLEDSWDWSAQIHYTLVSGDKCRIETIPGTGSGTAAISETADWQHVNGDGTTTYTQEPGTPFVAPYGALGRGRTHNARVGTYSPIAAWEFQPPFFEGDDSQNLAVFWANLQRIITVQTSHCVAFAEPNNSGGGFPAETIPDGIRFFDEEAQATIDLDENSAAFVVFDLPFVGADVGDSIQINFPSREQQLGAFPTATGSGVNVGLEYYEVALDYSYTETVTEAGISEFVMDEVNVYRDDSRFESFWDEWDNHQWVLLWRKNGRMLISNLSVDFSIHDSTRLQYKVRTINTITLTILDATPINATILYVEERIYPGTLDNGYVAILTNNNWLSYILFMARQGWLKNSNLYIKNGIPTIATANQPKNSEVATDRTMHAELLQLIGGKWIRREAGGEATSMPLGTPIDNSWWGYYG